VIQLVCRFRVRDPEFAGRARAAVALLSAQPTCEQVRLARSTEDPRSWVLTAEFPSFAGYRRALSPFDVRTTVIPFLSEADQQTSGVVEVTLTGYRGVLTEHETVVDPAEIWSGDGTSAG
jgi:hypothetical protein